MMADSTRIRPRKYRAVNRLGNDMIDRAAAKLARAARTTQSRASSFSIAGCAR